MSHSDLDKFLELVKQDQHLQDSIKSDPSLPSIIALAAQKGFSFTEEDIKSHSTDLADVELESVAGGFQLELVAATPFGAVMTGWGACPTFQPKGKNGC